MQQQQYKVIVLDLDGTLTNDKKEITPRTRSALTEAMRLGVKVVLASGRPVYGITALAEELDLKHYGGYIMAFNGGKIIDCGSGEVIFNQQLDDRAIPLLYREAKESGMEILTYQGPEIVTTKRENKYVLTEAFINKMKVRQLDDFPKEVVPPLNKCLIVGDPNPLHQLELQLSVLLKGKVDVYRSAGFFLECVPPGVDKSLSLQRLLDRLHLTREEVIACGDGYNDLSMIRFAGLGVAMANAAKEVQDAADYVTWSNEEDGVEHVVEKFVLRAGK